MVKARAGGKIGAGSLGRVARTKSAGAARVKNNIAAAGEVGHGVKIRVVSGVARNTRAVIDGPDTVRATTNPDINRAVTSKVSNGKTRIVDGANEKTRIAGN